MQALWDVKWEARYEALAAYRREHGHCRVPLTSGDQSVLARWVILQRRAWRQGALSAKRVRRLGKLGFWDVQGERERMKQPKWEAKYESLAAYRRAHGHCGAPRQEFPQLRQWVVAQRAARRRKIERGADSAAGRIGFRLGKLGRSVGKNVCGPGEIQEGPPQLQRARRLVRGSATGRLGGQSKDVPCQGNAHGKPDRATGGPGLSLQLPGDSP